MKRLIPWISVCVLFFLFQTAFIVADIVETPQKVTIAFTKALYQLDESVDKYVTEEGKKDGEIDLLKQFRFERIQKAALRGYRPGFAKNYLVHINTDTLSESHDKADVRITAERFSIIPWLRMRKMYEVDHTFKLVKEDGAWKINSGIELID